LAFGNQANAWAARGNPHLRDSNANAAKRERFHHLCCCGPYIVLRAAPFWRKILAESNDR
jgi:hypothetical protein